MNDLITFLLVVTALTWTVLGAAHMFKLHTAKYFDGVEPKRLPKIIVMMFLCGPIAWGTMIVAAILVPFMMLYDWARY